MLRQYLLRASLGTIALLGSANAEGGELLDLAVEENGVTSQAPTTEVTDLVARGDKLAAQERFNEAIDLYSQAFRLAPDDESNYVRLLVAKRAAGRLDAGEREALQLLEEQEAADVRQAFRSARLGLLQAKQSMRDGDSTLARTRWDAARAALDGLPADVDTSVYRQELASVRRLIERNESKQGEKAVPAVNRKAVPKTPKVAVAEIDGPILPGEFGDDQLAMPEEDAEPIHESGEVVEVGSLLEHDRHQYVYEREMADALRRNRAEWVFQIEEAAHAAVDDMTFPADWAERTAKRRGSRDGVIYEGKPFQGDDGETYVTAIYDLGDLVHPVPNFAATYPGTAGEQYREQLDREALRNRSYIFGGYAEDLAAGLPLLPFFGGVDTNAVTRRCDPNETDRVIHTIEAFLNR